MSFILTIPCVKCFDEQNRKGKVFINIKYISVAVSNDNVERFKSDSGTGPDSAGADQMLGPCSRPHLWPKIRGDFVTSSKGVIASVNKLFSLANARRMFVNSEKVF